MKIGVYVDLPLSLLEKDKAKIAQLKVVDTWFVMVETFEGKRKFTPKQFNEARKILGGGLRLPPSDVVPVICPSPKRLNRGYFEWVHSFGEYRVRADLEHNWLQMAGGVTKHDAQILRSEINPEVTTLWNHLESSAKKSLVGRYAPLLEIQAYSTRTMLQKRADAYPGDWQRFCFRDGVECNGKPPALALPAYSQSGIKDASGRVLDPVEAMRRAYLAAAELGAPEANYWSLRHILRLPYAWRFMTQVLPSLRGSCLSMPHEPVAAKYVWKGCHAASDGECAWKGCPQLRDGEPARSSRHCPLDRDREER